MEVVNYKAYRIVDTDRGAKYKINEELPIENYSTENYSPKKKTIEQILEDNRPTTFVSRNEALFVFPESEYDYESVWTNFKYSHNEKEYLLLELKLTGKLYWLDAGIYNECYAFGKTLSDEQVKGYWTEIKESDFTNSMDIEGLFTGTAIIKKIVRKKHCSNGDNTVIE